MCWIHTCWLHWWCTCLQPVGVFHMLIHDAVMPLGLIFTGSTMVAMYVCVGGECIGGDMWCCWLWCVQWWWCWPVGLCALCCELPHNAMVCWAGQEEAGKARNGKKWQGRFNYYTHIYSRWDVEHTLSPVQLLVMSALFNLLSCDIVLLFPEPFPQTCMMRN